MIASGSPHNAIVRRAGATSEMDSSVMLEQVRVVEDAPGVERAGGSGPLVSPEVVVIASFVYERVVQPTSRQAQDARSVKARSWL